MRAIEPMRLGGVRLADVLPTSPPSAAEVFATCATTEVSLVQSGDVFFAPRGEAAQVLEQAKRAVSAGAKAVVVGQPIPLDTVPLFVVADPAEAYGKFCHAALGQPCQSLEMVAVAGGYGKTCVARLIASIYQQAGHTMAEPPERERNSAAATAKWLASSYADGASVAVVESPAEAAFDNRFGGVELDAVCLTNLTSPSTPAGSSVEAIRRATRDAVRRLTPEGVIILNADDQVCCGLLSEWDGPALTFGLGETADVTAQVLQRHTGGQELLLSYGSDSVVVGLSTIGDAFVSNCLAATATALATGIDLQTIAKGLQAAQRPSAMMRPVVCGQTFPVYLDSAATPSAVAAAVRAAGAVTQRRVLSVVTPKTLKHCRQFIHAARSASDFVAVAGEGLEDCEQVEGVRVVEDRFSATALVLALADPGDSVVIVGCEDSGDGPDEDELIVRQLLELRMRTTEELASAG